MCAKKVKKILLVEDEKPISHVLALKLKSSGFEVDAVYNGADALSKLKGGKYDLVLLDLMLPEVDGFGVLEGMKKSKNKTPVIILSNLSQAEDTKRTSAYGVKDYFVKSNISLSEVVKHVNKVLKL